MSWLAVTFTTQEINSLIPKVMMWLVVVEEDDLLVNPISEEEEEDNSIHIIRK